MTLVGKMMNAAAPASLALLAALAASPASAQLRSNVSAATHVASDLGPVDRSQAVNITVHLKSPNQAAFDKAVDALYDSASPTFHHWFTDEDLKKYAPPQAQLDEVKKELESRGLTILSTDTNGFSLRARGTASQVEEAFNTHIHNFQHSGKVFRANTEEARLSGEAANYVDTVAGIESHTIRPQLRRAINLKTKQPLLNVPLNKVKQSAGGLGSIITEIGLTPPSTFTFDTPGESLPTGVYYGNVYEKNPNLIVDYNAGQLQSIYGLNEAFKQGMNGEGQTIVLLEAYGYPDIMPDANAFSKLMGVVPLTSSNFTILYPQGKPDPQLGVITGWDGEIALDVQWAHSMAPRAKIAVVVAAGQDSEDFQAAMTWIIDHNIGYSVSDSWEEDTDILSGPAEQQSFETVLQRAAAKGISFQFSTGDDGDEGLGTPLGADGVPSDAPHATAVGGTSILNVVGSTSYETLGWGNTLTFIAVDGPLDPPEPLGFIGGSGGGESLYFKKPSWQKSLPGTGRQTPDVSALADPYTGVPIVLTEGGVQYFEAGNGGTSLASPIFTAIWAIANQKAGHPLGQAAPAIAALAPGNILDVLPASLPTNVSGTVVDGGGSTYYSPSALFAGTLYDTTGFTSAIWDLGFGEYIDFGFGIDSSLTVTPGWDNVTGFGTPNGVAFINAVAK